MTKRSRIKGYYVTRDKKGRFKNWTSVGKSLASDRKRKAKKVKRGYGDRGDVYEESDSPWDWLWS